MADRGGAQASYGATVASSPRIGSTFAVSDRLLIGGGTFLGVLAVWELVARSGLINPLFISSPTLVAGAWYHLFSEGEIWNDLRVSATEFLAGYLMAAGVAIPLGLAVGWYRRLSYLLGPFIDTLNAVPRVTLLPLIVIWCGIGLWSKIVVVFLGAVVPLLINTAAGVRTNEERFLRVARSFGASQLRIFWTIVLPGTVPFIFTGLKYAAGRALLGVVVGELYAATAGIGFLIAVSGNSFQTDKVFAGILIVTFTGLLTVEVLNRLERRFEAWRPRVGSAA